MKYRRALPLVLGFPLRYAALLSNPTGLAVFAD